MNLLETDNGRAVTLDPLSSALLEAKLKGAIVWTCPPGPHEDRKASYTSIYRSLTVPDYFDEPVKEDKADTKTP